MGEGSWVTLNEEPLTRRRIYELIRKSPGIHFRELQKKLGIAVGNLQYHLDRLEELGLIESVRENGYKRYYATTLRFSDEEKKIMSALRVRTEKLILIYLLINPFAKERELSKALNLSPSTISWHISKLVKLGIIDKVRNKAQLTLRIKDPEKVEKMLITYRETLIDKLVEGFVEVWGPEWLKKKSPAKDLK
jgi:predicted transcriptional regulator